MKRFHVPCIEILLIVGGFFAIIAADGFLDVAGVVIFNRPTTWASVLRVVNHPRAPH